MRSLETDLPPIYVPAILKLMDTMRGKKTKRVDAVGIEPTTFHMCEDAKRLKSLLVRSSDENRS